MQVFENLLVPTRPPAAKAAMVWETLSQRQAGSQGPLSPLVSLGTRIWDVKLVKVEEGPPTQSFLSFSCHLALGADLPA